MTFFDFLRFLHIAAAILWVGGGIVIALGAEFARHRRGPASMFAIVDLAALMGPRFFVPVSFLTLATGIVAAWFGPGFAQTWVMFGLAGSATTFMIGLFIIKPRSEDIAALMAGAQADDTVILAKTRDLMTLARFDHLILLLVVASMVLKPSPSDVGMLVGMGTILVLGFAVTTLQILRGGRSGSPERRPLTSAAHR